MATTKTAKTAAVDHPRLASKPARASASSLANSPNGGNPSRAMIATAMHPPSAGRRGEEAAQFGDPCRAFGEGELTDSEERGGLAERVRDDVQEQRGSGESGADRGGEREDAHVFDARVGEEPFGVALADHERCGDDEGEQCHRDEQPAHVARAEPRRR